MRITDPKTGQSIVRKRRRRYDEAGQARELTFSCYRRFQFLSRDRTRQWFIDALEAARRNWPIDLWAYCVMPEHVHLLVYPREQGVKVGRVAGEIKEDVARKAIGYLEEHAPEWLSRITVREGAACDGVSGSLEGSRPAPSGRGSRRKKLRRRSIRPPRWSWRSWMQTREFAELEPSAKCYSGA